MEEFTKEEAVFMLDVLSNISVNPLKQDPDGSVANRIRAIATKLAPIANPKPTQEENKDVVA